MGKQTNEKKKKKSALNDFKRFLKVVNFLMPYILSVSFVVLLFSLLGIIGTPGKFISAPFLGLFSIAGSAYFAIMLLYHAIVWKYDRKHKICLRRVICTFVATISVSVIQHLLQYSAYHTGSPTKLFTQGLSGDGGGVVGGIIAYFLAESVTVYGAAAIMLLILLFMLLQMFNITPFSIVIALFKAMFDSKGKKKDKEPKEKKVKHKKGKKVEIFDDTVDTDELKLEEATKAKPAYLDISKYINADTEVIARTSEIKYNSLDEHLERSRGTSSSQLKPYSDRYSLQSSDELNVKSSFVEEDEPSLSQLRPVSRSVEEHGSLYKSAPVFEDRDSEDFSEENLYDTSAYSTTKSTENSDEIKKSLTPVFEFNADVRSEKGYKTQAEVEEDLNFDFESTVVSISSFGHTGEVKVPKDEAAINEAAPEIYEEIDSYEEASDTYEQEVEAFEQAEAVNEAPIEQTQEESKLENDAEFGYLDDLIEKSINAPKPTSIPKKESIAFDDAASYIPVSDKPKKEVKVPPKKKTPKRSYKFPPIQFLQEPIDNSDSDEARAELNENARIIVETLNNFNARTTISAITRGPTVTRYELVPEAGVRVRSIANLVDDIQLNLAAKGIRIECPIPGKSAVGIEVPNRVASTVYLREIVDSQQFKSAKGKLFCALGKSISGENQYVDIEKTPHLLVAGATGMGKSVCINSLLVSLLYKATPDDVRLILIDPKKVELSNYNGVPHLLVPVVCEPKKSLGALQWAVTEMDNRFEIIEAAGVRNLIEFNEKVDKGYDADKMSRILIVIDELADLKMQVPDIEGHITRLTQKARAAGIHIIIGTQRPSVDVLTGLIKSNIPSRISFRVPSQIDSRTVLDEVGAEKLVSRGDMLVKLVGSLSPVRVQGAYVSADEIEEVINFWKENTPAIYDEEVMHQIDSNAAKLAKNDKDFDSGEEGGEDGDLDAAFFDALEIATEMGKISSSFLQRKLRLGFQRAARIIDQMEECGYIGEANGSKPRDVLITKEDYQEIMMRRSDD